MDKTKLYKKPTKFKRDLPCKAVLPSISPNVHHAQSALADASAAHRPKSTTKTVKAVNSVPKVRGASVGHKGQLEQLQQPAGVQHTLVLDSRLSDPQTRNQFNKEFAKKITSTGVGAPELYGIPSERLPSFKAIHIGLFLLSTMAKVS